jgi:hypothetical protein
MISTPAGKFVLEEVARTLGSCKWRVFSENMFTSINQSMASWLVSKGAAVPVGSDGVGYGAAGERRVARRAVAAYCEKDVAEKKYLAVAAPSVTIPGVIEIGCEGWVRSGYSCRRCSRAEVAESICPAGGWMGAVPASQRNVSMPLRRCCGGKSFATAQRKFGYDGV